MNRVLLVDDNEIDLRFVHRLFQGRDQWRVELARNGREALERLDAKPFDVVITDLMMPVLDGLGLLAESRKRFPCLPVVIMTSRGSEEIAVQALQNGAASYLSKRDIKTQLNRVLQSVFAAASRGQMQSRLMSHLVGGELSFAIPNDRELLMASIRFLQEAAKQAGALDEMEWTRLGIALEEAMSNAMIHGNLEVNSDLREQDDGAYDKLIALRRFKSPYCDRRVHVTAGLHRGKIEFVIRDDGPGFDTKKIGDPTSPDHLTRPHGRGLFMIHQFMDEVRHNETGNEVTLVKRQGQNAELAVSKVLECIA